MTKRMVVTGKSGQVVSALHERVGETDDFDIVTVGRPELDFTALETIASAIESAAPDIVVNAAAYTAVDNAESEPDLTMRINADAAGEVARGAALAGAPIIQVSTDYVFDGRQRRSYREDDGVAPLGVYGRSKLAGELNVASANPDHFIFRTAWVYSPFGHNFVKTMLRLSHTRESLDVVDDQLGNPTSAHDIADGIIAAARKILDEQTETEAGIYHLSGTGTASWCEFARAIFDAVGRKSGRNVAAHPITTEEFLAAFAQQAVRPQNSRLDCARFAHAFGYRAPEWRQSLSACIDRLV